MNQQTVQSIYKEHFERSLFINETSQRDIYWLQKRGLDIFVAGIGLFLALPVLLSACLAIRFESKGPIFYRQTRVGKDGIFFEVLKLRTMRVDAEKSGPQWAKKNDDRVTKVGNFLRKSRIDEIPQLLNVLYGDMSMVGPRPERPNFTLEFNQQVPGFIERLQVKPGITGLAQVQGGYDLTPGEKLELDKKYINSKNLLIDIDILIKTVVVVLTGHGAR